MARRVKDKKLDSREQRLKLKVSGKPYYRAVERNVHLGYRRLRGGAGSWCARFYLGEGIYEVEAIGVADDVSDPDGVAFLDFWQAQEKARKRLAERTKAPVGKTGPYTVGDAMDAYAAHLENEGRAPQTIVDIHHRDQALIRPKLGDLKVGDLTADILRDWRNGLVKAPTRTRTLDPRARRATANRVWTVLRAALNLAFRHNKVDSDKAWKQVEPYKGVDKPRDRYLSLAECKRLVNTCEPDFRDLAIGALQTGGRYGQLAAATVGDFNVDAGTLTMHTRKGRGTVRQHHVHLTSEGVDFFRALCAKRGGAGALIFVKADGTAWGKAHQSVRMEVACARAKIEPAIGFHGLRHTWASHAVMNGVPLLVVAQNLGHSDTRMVERVYGHLAPSYRQDEIRKGAPVFGIEPDVAVLR